MMEKYDIVEVVSAGYLVQKEMIGWVGTVCEVPISAPPCVYVEWAKDYCRCLSPDMEEDIFNSINISLVPISSLSTLEKGTSKSYMERKVWSIGG